MARSPLSPLSPLVRFLSLGGTQSRSFETKIHRSLANQLDKPGEANGSTAWGVSRFPFHRAWLRQCFDTARCLFTTKDLPSYRFLVFLPLSDNKGLTTRDSLKDYMLYLTVLGSGRALMLRVMSARSGQELTTPGPSRLSMYAGQAADLLPANGKQNGSERNGSRLVKCSYQPGANDTGALQAEHARGPGSGLAACNGKRSGSERNESHLGKQLQRPS